MSFWTGGVSNPLSVIEQFTYLLFIRRLDELQSKEEKRAFHIKQPVKRLFFTEEQNELRWSYFKHRDPVSMFELFTKPMVDGLNVFEHMKSVGLSFKHLK